MINRKFIKKSFITATLLACASLPFSIHAFAAPGYATVGGVLATGTTSMSGPNIPYNTGSATSTTSLSGVTGGVYVKVTYYYYSGALTNTRTATAEKSANASSVSATASTVETNIVNKSATGNHTAVYGGESKSFLSDN